MNRLRSLVRLLPLGLAALGFAAAGCTPSVDVKTRSDIPAGEKEIRHIVSLYLAYGQANPGKSPANAEQLKAWAKKLPPEKLKEMEIDNLDQVFVSPRDNKPFVVLPKSGPGPGKAIAYEQTGVGGKRYVAMGVGSVREFDEEAFKQFVPNPAH